MTEGREPRAGRKPNRLIDEQSPYLLQHAYNPVDWYPWGEEALARARDEDRPILLSIGYSACHWCHVMERESFENPEIAVLMNRNAVCIKVDREERPDLDHVYQLAAQLLGSQGGWPLTLFLTPQKIPFYAGTYFPPVDRHGLPGFPRVVETVCRIYREDRSRVEQVAAQVQAALQMVQEPGGITPVSPGRGQAGRQPGGDRLLVDQALRWLEDQADRQEGGFGTQPKFPNVPLIRLFLAEARFGKGGAGNPHVQHALFTLDRILAGGIHDQLGGGFHRYSTDRRWRVPHFEKMLYDNAQIPLVLLEAYQLTGADRYREGAVRALEYLLREMRHPRAGGFCTSQDADAGGQEGGTFLWTPGELEAVLDPDDARLAQACLGVTRKGDLEGRSVLHQALAPQEAADRLGIPASEAERRLAGIRSRLLEARGRREQPGRDDKVLVGWNGLAIATFARAGAVLGEARYVKAARDALAFILGNLLRPDGTLLRSYRTRPAPIAGQLEDYAFLAWGCLELFQATFEPAYLQAAHRLGTWLEERFWDAEAGGFFLTAPPEGEGGGDVPIRPKEATDQSLPAPAAAAGWVFLALGALLGEDRWRQRVEALLDLHRPQMEANPWGYGSLLLLLEVAEGGWHEVTLAVPPEAGAETLREWNRAVHGPYAPDRLAAGTAPLASLYGETAPELPPAWNRPLPEPLALLEGKETRDGQVQGFLCRHFTCTPPLTDPEELRRQLAGASQDFPPGG